MRYSFGTTSWATGAGSADNAVITACGFFLGGNSATMQLKVNEVQSGGEAGSSSVQIAVLARDTTNAATPTQRNPTAMDATSTAPATLPISGNAATTLPTRGAAPSHLIQHSFNAYGGLVRWQARQGEEITTITATAANSELSYSLFTGSTAGTTISTHVIFEEV